MIFEPLQLDDIGMLMLEDLENAYSKGNAGDLMRVALSLAQHVNVLELMRDIPVQRCLPFHVALNSQSVMILGKVRVLGVYEQGLSALILNQYAAAKARYDKKTAWIDSHPIEERR